MTPTSPLSKPSSHLQRRILQIQHTPRLKNRNSTFSLREPTKRSDLGVRKKTIFYGSWSINTGLGIGRQSRANSWIVEESSAVRDGTTTSVKESIRQNGLSMKSGFWPCVSKPLGTNGLWFLNTCLEEPTTRSKTIGTAKWSQRRDASKNRSSVSSGTKTSVGWTKWKRN